MKCAAAILLLLALVSTASAIAPVTNAVGGWRAGRATFYGGSQQYLQNFPARGPPPEYGFGTPLYGSCGYLSQDGNQAVDFSNVPFPVDMLSAVANINDDYPGSCGRCYEIQCSTGVVVGNYSTATGTPTAIPYNTSTGFIEPGLNYDTVVDDYNRKWNGNPLMSQNELFTQCWNGSQALGLLNEPDNSIYIHVTDNCPCLQYDGGSTTVTGDNPPCCGNVNHFDLSYYGFEKLAHPNYGLMNLQFRPVDCYTKVPLDYLPGYINETIYGDNIETGWAWYPFPAAPAANAVNNKQLQVQGAGVGGSNATCVDVNSEGGLSLVSRLANTAGYQPFLANNATTLSFYVKQTSAANIGTGSGVPAGLSVSIGNSEQAYYCTGLPLTSLTASDVSNGLTHLTVPISQFNCNLPLVDELSFQNTNAGALQFCLDDIALTGGSPADPHMYSSV